VSFGTLTYVTNAANDSSEGTLRVYEELGLLSRAELREFVEVEEARAELRREWGEGVDDTSRRRQILEQSNRNMSRQLKLVRRRSDEVARVEVELIAKRKRVRQMLRELDVE
jgi:hypothetical protein